MTFKSIGTASLYVGIDSEQAASQYAVGSSSLSDSSSAAQNDICALHRAFNVARVRAGLKPAPTTHNSRRRSHSLKNFPHFSSVAFSSSSLIFVVRGNSSIQ